MNCTSVFSNESSPVQQVGFDWVQPEYTPAIESDSELALEPEPDSEPKEFSYLDPRWNKIISNCLPT